MLTTVHWPKPSIMKALGRSLLRGFGLEVRRIKSHPVVDVDPFEINEINQILRRFARGQSPGDSLSDFGALRGYLSDVRISFFHDLVTTVREAGVQLDNQSVADVGSGMGYLLRLLSFTTQDSRLFGFDSFAELNALARLLCPEATIEDRALATIDQEFGVVFCTELLEHMLHPETALQRLLSLADGGALVLTVPNGRTDHQAAGEMREDGSAYWGHINFWSPESWNVFLQTHAGTEREVHTGLLRSGENFAVIRGPHL